MRQVGDPHAAATRLAEIVHCLPMLRKASRQKWTERLQIETLPDDFIQAIKVGLENDVQRIRRVLSIGTTWNGEEILLVLTLRIQVDLGVAFLNDWCSVEVKTNTADIDECIVRLSKTREHKRHFAESIGLMKKNWGLPINSRWFDL